MDSTDPHVLEWKETQDVHTRSIPQKMEFNKIAADFGLLIVKSALVLNGGALLALPAYISAINAEPQADAELLYTSAACFIGGIILATLTAYCAYLNFLSHAGIVESQSESEIIEIEEDYDITHQHRLAPHRKVSRDELQKWTGIHTKIANCTVLLAQIFGLATYVLFIVGCYYGGRVMLGGV